MKKILLCIMCIMSLAVLGSCDNKQKIAKEIVGSWTGTPMRVNDQTGTQVTMINSYIFRLDSVENAMGGQLIITSLVSSMTQIVGEQGFIEPISLSASSTVTITGKWRLVNDNMEIALNIPSLKVAIDPSAVVVSDNALTDQDTPELASLRTQAAANIEAQIRAMMTLRYSRLRGFDDVKIKDGNIMKFEIGKEKCTLMRQ